MYLLRITTGILVLVAFRATPLAAEQPSQNAALAYWQAFAMLPSTNDEQDEILRGSVGEELNEQAMALIEKSQGSMKALRRGTSLSECDWGLEFSAGPMMVMPHLSKAREIVRFAGLHARKNLADGDVDAAMDVLHDSLVLARRSGRDDVIISLLVQYAMEEIVMDILAYHLPELNANQVDALAQRLDSLPQGGSMLASLKIEQKSYVGWARRAIKKAKSDDEAVRLLKSAIVNAGPEETPAPNVTREQIGKWLDETWQDYEDVFVLFDAPHDEFDSRWEKLVESVRKDNPFSAMVLPAVGRIRHVCDKNSTQWALFRAAMKVVRDGEDARQTFKDPFADGPFGYEKLSNGFRLTSKLRYRDEPVSLTVGK